MVSSLEPPHEEPQAREKAGDDICRGASVPTRCRRVNENCVLGFLYAMVGGLCTVCARIPLSMSSVFP